MILLMFFLFSFAIVHAFQSVFLDAIVEKVHVLDKFNLLKAASADCSCIFCLVCIFTYTLFIYLHELQCFSYLCLTIGMANRFFWSAETSETFFVDSKRMFWTNLQRYRFLGSKIVFQTIVSNIRKSALFTER